MFVKIGSLYINTNNLQSIALYKQILNTQQDGSANIDYGISINGVKYPMYRLQGIVTNDINEYVSSLVQTLITQILGVIDVSDIKELDKPELDLTQFEKKEQ